ncbi:DAZ-associated protein 1 [Dermatophagoides farinae]|uniref:DAZ-associated protein 1 n=1 Tax=Dermatophagoides farinae TaxID=6954 RepID=A0A922HIB2_DERFA|nr:DAZ-associated protein 1 [Dermatophagoides farinae]
MMADGAEEGKIFVGGLSWETNEDKLRDYFTEFGDVTECLIMKNPETGKSRGFGFVTFMDPNSVRKVLNVQNHQLDGRTIDPKECNLRTAAKSRKEYRHTNFSKIFLGGLPPNITETRLKEFFSKYGNVTEAIIMFDQEKKKSRGFGFLSFDNEESIYKVVAEHFVTINGKQVEVKRAEPQHNKSGTPLPTNGNIQHHHHHHGMMMGSSSGGIGGSMAAIGGAGSGTGGTNISMPYFMPSWPMWPTPVATMNGMSNISGYTPAAVATNVAWNPSTAAAAAAAIAATAAAGPPNWTPFGHPYPPGWPTPTGMHNPYGSTTPHQQPGTPATVGLQPPPTTPQQHHPMSPASFGHSSAASAQIFPPPPTNFLPPPPAHNMTSMNPNHHHHQMANGGVGGGSTSSVSNSIIPTAIGQTSIGNYHHETNSFSGVGHTLSHQQQPVGPNITNMYRPTATTTGVGAAGYPHVTAAAMLNNTHPQHNHHHHHSAAANSINAITNNLPTTTMIPTQQQQQQHSSQTPIAVIAAQPIHSSSSSSSDYIIGGSFTMPQSQPIPPPQLQQPNISGGAVGGIVNPNSYNQQSFHGSRMMNIQSQNQGYHPYRRS